MIRIGTHITACIMFVVFTVPVSAQTDTTFVYQGYLSDGGVPASGPHNIDVGLWDAASGGNQIGSTQSFPAHPVGEGGFSLELDFGASEFDNSSRWLEISVNGNTLIPRQPITRSPYSIQTRGIFVGANKNVGIGTTSPGSLLEVTGNAEVRTIAGYHTDTAGAAFGVSGQTASSAGSGVYGYATSATGGANGVHGRSNSDEGKGELGSANAVSGETFGVFGQSLSPDGTGVFGKANTNTGTNYGVYGQTLSSSGYAGYFEGGKNYFEGSVGIGTMFPRSPLDVISEGRATTLHATNTDVGGVGFAVFATSDSPIGTAVFGKTTANFNTNYGVVGHSSSIGGFDIYASGPGINYGSSSSARWKSRIEAIDDSLNKLSKLRGVYFDWDEEHGGHHDVGMIAEEVGAVLPEIVNYEENGVNAIGMDYSKLTPLLVEAVKALRTEKGIELAKRDEMIAKLAARNKQLEDRLMELELIVAQLVATHGDEE